jgi:hypothetical protein
VHGAAQVAEVGVVVDAVGQVLVVGEHEPALAGREKRSWVEKQPAR